DWHQRRALRHPWFCGAVPRRPLAIARMHTPDELGRGQVDHPGPGRHARGVAMTRLLAGVVTACIASTACAPGETSGYGPPPADAVGEPASGQPTGASPFPATGLSAVDELRARHLRPPVDGADLERTKGQFSERRDSGSRPHEAIDILAARGTAVHAV